MQIVSQIDRLIAKLNELKPDLSSNASKNQQMFDNILKDSISSTAMQNQEPVLNPKIEEVTVPTVPSWVDPNYSYDVNNPRKPYFREVVKAISGSSVEDLQSGSPEERTYFTNLASDLLYGVVGSNTDTRNWNKIMNSQNTLNTAREETGKMYEPKIEIISEFDSNEVLTSQFSILKDKSNNILRSLQADADHVEYTLNNFGITKESIPENLDNVVNKDIFDNSILQVLKDFRDKDSHQAPRLPSGIENTVLKSATDAISQRLNNTIPPEEFRKL